MTAGRDVTWRRWCGVGVGWPTRATPLTLVDGTSPCVRGDAAAGGSSAIEREGRALAAERAGMAARHKPGKPSQRSVVGSAKRVQPVRRDHDDGLGFSLVPGWRSSNTSAVSSRESRVAGGDVNWSLQTEPRAGVSTSERAKA